MSRMTRTLRGALAGAAAASVWAVQEPLDRRVFRVPYSDPALLGGWLPLDARPRTVLAAGLGLHVLNGAAFGALYANAAPSLPVPPALRGPLAGLAEHLATWPGTVVVARVHPERRRLPALWGSVPAFAQATWRHLVFGFVLGELERRLNPAGPPLAAVDDAVVASNGHGSPERLVPAG